MPEWKVGDKVQDPFGVTYTVHKIFPSRNCILRRQDNYQLQCTIAEQANYTILKEPHMQIPKPGDTIHLQGVISSNIGRIIGFDLPSGEQLSIFDNPQDYTITPRAPQVGDMVYLREAGEILYEVLAIRNDNVALWDPNRETMHAAYLDNISTTYQGA